MLGDDSIYLVFDCKITCSVTEVLQESRTIHVIHINDSFGDIRSAVCRCPNSKVSALTVSADPDRHGAEIICRRIKISRSSVLYRNRCLEGHLKVLLPPDNAVVCTAEADKYRSVRQLGGNCRKLLHSIVVNNIDITAKSNIRISWGFGCGKKQINNLCWHNCSKRRLFAAMQYIIPSCLVCNSNKTVTVAFRH